MKKNRGRVSVEKNRVWHFDIPVDVCHICGGPATHLLLGKNKNGKRTTTRKLYLCTLHMSQMLRLPANRYPKKTKLAKQIEYVPYPGYKTWSLRQHMALPYQFRGERIACHSAKIGAWTWYWSLYWRDGGDSNPIDHVLSVTRAIDKKHAVHMVQTMEGVDELVEMVKFMLHSHGTVAPINDAELLALTMEATRFIEACIPGKTPSAYRLACMERLNKWRRTTARAAIETEVPAEA